MRVTTKGRYALRVMLYIALHDHMRLLNTKEISENLNISVKYLEQILSSLSKAGFVRSIRGPKGGYVLAKAPEEYTVGAILRQTEGDLAPISGMDNEGNIVGEECMLEDDTLWVYIAINNALKSVVDSISLKDLIEHKLVEVGNYCI